MHVLIFRYIWILFLYQIYGLQMFPCVPCVAFSCFGCAFAVQSYLGQVDAVSQNTHTKKYITQVDLYLFFLRNSCKILNTILVN